MKLKLFAFLLVFVFVFSSIVGCSSSPSSTAASTSSPSSVETDKPFEGGSGTENDPYIIAEAYQWKNIYENLSAHYALACDISLASLDTLAPIGTASKPFTGTLDGRGFKIKNASVSARTDGGFFGVVSGATIKNLTLDSCVIHFGYKDQDRIFYGALAAQAKNGSLIENCHITSTDIKYDCSWGDNIYVGGLVGSLTGFSELIYCSTDTTFISKDSMGNINFGGVAGFAENAKVLGCAAEGTVSVKKPSGSLNNKTRKVAGLVFKANNTDIMYCYSALDFIDNTAPAYTAALVYTLDSESSVCYNASFNNFASEPGLANSADNAKYEGRYNSCGLMRGDSASVNIYFRASSGNSPEKMNSTVAGDKFGGAFKEGRVHPVLVDYEAFKVILEK
jgi:hypothetical protein